MENKKLLDEFEAQKYFKQIADALLCLNMNGIVHRDLKPANIMFTSAGDLKIVDFGLSRFFSKDSEAGLMETQYGTPLYQAPEILNGKGYDETADLWSVGIILFQMIAGVLPFPATSRP